jgi:hypothetical protein
MLVSARKGTARLSCGPNRGVIGNAHQHPSLQHARQFYPARLQGPGIRPDARDGRNVAVERPVILDNLVAGLAHGCPDLRRQHASVYPTDVLRFTTVHGISAMKSGGSQGEPEPVGTPGCLTAVT